MLEEEDGLVESCIQHIQTWNISAFESKHDELSASASATPSDDANTVDRMLHDFSLADQKPAAVKGLAGNDDDDDDSINPIASSWCAECRAESRITDDGYQVCTQCGDVGEIFIDASPEWRFYGQDDAKSGDPSRCGMSANYLMPHSSVGTVISARYGESYHMRQARQYHSWNVLDYRGRNLYRIFERLQGPAQKHGINYMIIEHAKQLFKTIDEHQLFRGLNKEGLIADCVYRACKDKGVPRSIKEIAVIFGIDEAVMTKGNRCFTKVWNKIQNDASIHLPPQSNRNMCLSQPTDYVERFCSPLSLPHGAVDACLRVAKIVQDGRLVSDNTAPSVAAAVIFYVVNVRNLTTTKEEIARASKKSEVTIGKCYKKLLVYDGHLRPTAS